jgi:major type 1 subunit fimbrin (pilin)
MRRIRNYLSSLSGVGPAFALLFTANSANAQVTCTGNMSITPGTSFVAGNMTIGRDLANGAILGSFGGNTVYPGSSDGGITCTGPAGSIVPITITPTSPISGYNGGTYNGYALYDTGYSGIGYYVPILTNTVALSSSGTWNSNAASWPLPNGLVFVKTGSIPPGTYNAITIPAEKISVGGILVGGGGSPWPGQVTIVAGTCSTPDVTVALGTHKGSEFAGVGTGTNWLPFNIQLTNCPPFYGHDVRGTTTAIQNGSGNTIGVIFTPAGTSPLIDGIPGTIAVAPANGETGSVASGVGIQIADGNGVLQTLDGVTVNPALSFSQLDATVVAGNNFQIPLKARYIQTSPVVQGGQANGSLYFTLNYQ